MSFDILSQMEVSIPKEPIMPISASSRTRDITPVPIGAILNNSTRHPVTRQDTPNNAKILHLKRAPLEDNPAAQRAHSMRALYPAIPQKTESNPRPARGPVSTHTIDEILHRTAQTTTAADYEITLDEKAALLPLLEKREKLAREQFMAGNKEFLDHREPYDNTQAQLQLEEIALHDRLIKEDDARDVAEARELNERAMGDFLRETFLAEEAAQKKKTDFIRELVEFERQQTKLREQREAQEHAEFMEAREAARQYFVDRERQEMETLQKMRKDASENAAIVQRVIEEKKEARRQEILQERQLEQYAGPSDNVEAMRVHDQVIRSLIREAEAEAKAESQARLDAQRVSFEKEKEEVRELSALIRTAVAEDAERRRVEAKQLREAYDGEVQRKKEEGEQEAAKEYMEYKALEARITVEQAQDAAKKAAMRRQEVNTTKKNLQESKQASNINARFNDLLAKIIEYESQPINVVN